MMLSFVSSSFHFSFMMKSRRKVSCLVAPSPAFSPSKYSPYAFLASSPIPSESESESESESSSPAFFFTLSPPAESESESDDSSSPSPTPPASLKARLRSACSST